jgi:tetratricopeptide (TPR) repeat protein
MTMKQPMAATLAALAIAALAPNASAQKPKGPKEAEALNAVFTATTPDARIAAGDNVLTNFSTTDFKSIVLFMMAEAYGQKNDDAKMIVFGERALEADPKNFQAALLLASGIARKVRENDLDKDERLKQAEKYANDGMAMLATATKPNPQMTDEQWNDAKKDFAADAHQALGMVATVRKKNDDAVNEFKQAVEGAANPDPAAMVRYAQALNKVGKYDEAIAMADKVMAIPNVNPAFKQFAQAEKVRAFQAKQPK